MEGGCFAANLPRSAFARLNRFRNCARSSSDGLALSKFELGPELAFGVTRCRDKEFDISRFRFLQSTYGGYQPERRSFWRRFSARASKSFKA